MELCSQRANESRPEHPTRRLMRRPRNAASAAALATPVGGAAGGVGVGVNVGSVLAVVLSVSVWLRATRNAAMQSTHPDEVYQGIEQAHVLAHGYGMVPFEYTRDAALRSHALPLVYAAVMRVCDTLGLDYHQYSLPATRLLHHILTGVLVPLAGYAVARAHGGSRAAACGAAGVLAVNDYIVGVGSQTLSSGLTGAAIMLVASALSRASRGGRPSTTVPRLATELSAGLVVGCMAYVRPDSAILAAALLLVSPTSWVCSAVAAMARARQLLAIGAGAAVAAAGGAALDSFMYGRATFSPFNWFRYNILDAKSQVHGVSAQTFYVEHLLPLRNPLVWVVLGAAVAECARLCLWHPTCPRRDDPRTGTAAPGSADGEGATPAPAQDENNDQTQRDKSTTLGAFTSLKSVSAPANGGERATTALRGPTGHSDGAPPLLLLAQALAVGAVFSLVPHKEVRFVHDAYALLVVFAVVVLVRLCDEVLLPRVEWVAQEPRRTWALMATAAIVGWLACAGVDQRNMHMQKPGDPTSNYVLRNVGGFENCTGVIVMETWYRTGGWSALHKEVPIAFYLQNRALIAQPRPSDNPWMDQVRTDDEGDVWTNVFAEHATTDITRPFKDLRFNYVMLPLPADHATEEAVWQYGFDSVDLESVLSDAERAAAVPSGAVNVALHHRSARMSSVIATQGPGAIQEERDRAAKSEQSGQ